MDARMPRSIKSMILVSSPHAEQALDLETSDSYRLRGGKLRTIYGVQARSTVRNTSWVTRYSVDRRAVNVEDVVSGRSVPNVDSRLQGKSLHDFRRAADLPRL